ncbi:MAG TPA: hypothetical protein DD381_13025 [Lentisphaeria bacterium]|nr:MAG: hypothetical protein A2X47_12585 [Lentisphaerae bacterium GWF2_38_69]HBM17245.1 hypothetical protein [Lentisphaeria bacterium]
MRRQKIEQKDVVIPYCEGETEISLFGFLKHQYSNGRISFKQPDDLKGVSAFPSFKRKYEKKVKELNFKPARNYEKVRLLFIIDNDLADSAKIKKFLDAEKHLVQLCDPNTEGMILNIIGKPQAKTVGNKDYRKKCKDAFESHFGCKAHKLQNSLPGKTRFVNRSI